MQPFPTLCDQKVSYLKVYMFVLRGKKRKIKEKCYRKNYITIFEGLESYISTYKYKKQIILK